MLRASIVVPTRNRCSLLDRCLASLASQTLPLDEFEIVVVDNGSTDETRRVADVWSARVPNLRVEFEPATGLARARNTGIRLSEGDVVAFVDDDVVATEGWLTALLEAYARMPEVSAVVGPVRVVWPQERPRWLLPEMERWFSGLDLGDAPRQLSASELPFGANMSVRRSALRLAGGFAEELGRRGDDLMANEERELFGRLRGLGLSVGYEPSAVVRHEVEAERVSRSWLLRRAYAQGRSDVVLARRVGERGSIVTARAFRGLAGAVLGWVTVLVSLVNPERLGGVLVVEAVRQARALGYLREALVPSSTRRRRDRGYG